MGVHLMQVTSMWHVLPTSLHFNSLVGEGAQLLKADRLRSCNDGTSENFSSTLSSRISAACVSRAATSQGGAPRVTTLYSCWSGSAPQPGAAPLTTGPACSKQRPPSRASGLCMASFSGRVQVRLSALVYQSVSQYYTSPSMGNGAH